MIIRKLIIIILIIIGGLALLTIGYFTGVGSIPAESQQEVVKTTGAINSKVIKTIIASGEVSNVFDRIITITSEGESIDIFVKEDTQISSTSIVSEKGKVSTTKQGKAEFSDIKIDSQVSVIIKIMPDNKIEAISVNILPVFNNPKQ